MWFILILLIIAVLYLWLICPRLFGKPDLSIFEETLFAHRGLFDNDSEAPENSLRAFAKAAEHGFGIELDVQLSKDKKVVVFHDGTLDRVCGVHGRVGDFTLAELQQMKLCGSEETIPTFESVLSLVDGRVPLIVELKSERAGDIEVCGYTDALLQKYEGIYCIESFNPFIVKWYREHRRDVVRGQLSMAFTKDDTNNQPLPVQIILENLLFNFMTAPDFIAYDHTAKENLSRWIVRVLYGCKPVAWTIHSKEELSEAKKCFEAFIFQDFMPER